MFVRELTALSTTRVNWLATAQQQTASKLCSLVDAEDPPSIHCARLCLHIVTGLPVPPGYSMDLLTSRTFQDGLNSYLAPTSAHVLALALFTLPSGVMTLDVRPFVQGTSPELERALVFQLSRQEVAEDDLQLLSRDRDPGVRRVVARALGARESPYRVGLLRALLDDNVGSVVDAAASAAARSKVPTLMDTLASKGCFRALAFAGDPRAVRQIEALVESGDPHAGEEAVAMASALGERRLLGRLFGHESWDTRSNAILTAISKDIVAPDDPAVIAILKRETNEHLAELAVRWPSARADALTALAPLLCGPTGFLPSHESLASGRASAIERLRSWISSYPLFCGAGIRFLPHDIAVCLTSEMLDAGHAPARQVACRLVAERALMPCYVRVAELCIDDDPAVAAAAREASVRGRISPAVFGLDTAVLRAGSDAASAIAPKHALCQLIEAILMR